MSVFTSLDTDSIMCIQMHLKPRHLLELMLTNKELYKILKENKYYWLRVAIHLLFRNEIVGHPCNPSITKNMQKHLASYYDMVNLSKGYHHSMEDFMTLVTNYMKTKQLMFPEIAHPTVLVINTQATKSAWNHLAEASLEVKMRAMLLVIVKCEISLWRKNAGYKQDEVDTISVEEVCKRELALVVNNPVRHNKKVYKFINKIDDIQISVLAKKEIMKSVLETFSVDQDLYNIPMQAALGLPVDHAKLTLLREEQETKGLWLKYYLAGFVE